MLRECYACFGSRLHVRFRALSRGGVTIHFCSCMIIIVILL